MIKLSEEASKRIQEMLRKKKNNKTKQTTPPRYDDLYFQEIKKMDLEDTWEID